MNGVVIVAAGTGSRMNMGINKQFIKLEGKEIIAYTIEKFYNNSNIEDIVVVVKEDESEFFKKEILDKYNFKNVKINYEPEYFTSNPVIDSQNVYTLTMNDKVVDSYEINISIIGTILEVEELVNDSIVVNIGQEKVNIAVNIESSTDKVSGNIDETQNTNEVKEDSEKIDDIQNSTEVTDEVLGISEIDECEEITKS